MKNSFKTLILWTVPLLMGAALIISAVWGKAQQARAEEYEKLADEYVGICVDSCARCASELEAAVDEMSAALSKLRVTGSASGQVLALEDIVRESARAASVLSRIPCSQVDVLGTASYLVRAGDYARSLSAKLLRGGGLGKEDTEQLEAMLSAASLMRDGISARIADGSMPMGTEEFDYYDGGEDAQAIEYPALSYDGRYSEAAENAEPLGIPGSEGAAEEARAEAERIFGMRMDPEGTADGSIPTYEFSGENGMSVSVTVKGLRVIRAMGAPTGSVTGELSPKEKETLTASALEFLEKAGFSDMEPITFRTSGGAVLISFVSKKGDTLVYNDAVSVWMDRETGDPVGLDARGYFFMHREREICAPRITPEEAAEAFPENLEIIKSGLALVPLTPMTETLCYEFRCRLGDDEFMIRVNAETGDEEQVLLIGNDGEGEIWK